MTFNGEVASSARDATRPHALAGQLCVGIVWYPAAWWVSTVSFYPGIVLLTIAPLVILLTGRRILRTPSLVVDPALTYAAGFAVFLVAGLISLSTGSGIHSGGHGLLDQPFVARSVLQLSLIAGAIVLYPGCRVEASERPSALTHESVQRLTVFVQILVAFTAVGTILTVRDAGSLGQAVSILTQHNKEAAAALGNSTGRSAWQLFALPACTGLGALLVIPSALRRVKALLWAELCTILLIGLLVYGSRLLMTLALVGIGGCYFCLKRRPVGWGVVVATGLVVTLVSIPLLIARGNDRGGQTSTSSVANIVGYGILDVSLASLLVPEQIGQRLDDPQRLVLAAESIVPLVGVKAAELNGIRLDVIVAEYIDGGDLRRGLITGFPPSLPTALLLNFGTWLGTFAGWLFGITTAALSRWLTRRRDSTSSATYVFWCGFAVASFFNIFKDGDLVVDVAGLLKNVVVLLVIYGFVLMISTRRKGVASAHA